MVSLRGKKTQYFTKSIWKINLYQKTANKKQNPIEKGQDLVTPLSTAQDASCDINNKAEPRGAVREGLMLE